MKYRWSLLLLVLLSPRLVAEEPMGAATSPAAPVLFPGDTGTTVHTAFPVDGAEAEGGPLSGNHNFRNFINWMSNPTQNIDPRSMTAIYPLFGAAWISNPGPLPDGNMQLYGPAITVALSERLAVGLTDGGYAVAHFDRSQRARLAALDPTGRFSDVEGGGNRSGWLNLGGFFQYTLIEDVDDQFLLTAGLRWEAPSGSHDIFQGNGPAHLAPYLTFGKEFGEYHVLATTGYQFPARSGDRSVNLFNANLHLDRRICGWLYPLVELNWINHTTSVDFALPTREGFINFGNYESEGNVLTLAVGANAVLVPERFEIGAVYTTVIASQHNFDANGLLVKMTFRF